MDQEQATEKGWNFWDTGGTWLYENQFTLPVAFMLPADMETNWILDYGNPAYVQNDLCSLLGGIPGAGGREPRTAREEKCPLRLRKREIIMFM